MIADRLGNLLPRVGFIVTNLAIEPNWIVQFYNQRGITRPHIQEGNYAFPWARLECRRLHNNEFRLQSHALI